MVDDFDGDASAWWFSEGAAGVAVERFPCLFVDLGFEAAFERFVEIVRAEEISVADEEAFLVVVGVDEPTGDATGRTQDVDAAYRRRNFFVNFYNVNARLAKLGKDKFD